VNEGQPSLTARRLQAGSQPLARTGISGQGPLRHLVPCPTLFCLCPEGASWWLGSLVTHGWDKDAGSAGQLSPGLNQDRPYRPSAYRAAVLMSEPDSPVTPHFLG